MAAGGVAADDDAINIGAERAALAREPDDGAPALVDNRRNADVGTKVVVDDGDRDPLCEERRRDERKIALVERAPVAAVKKHERAR